MYENFEFSNKTTSFFTHKTDETTMAWWQSRRDTFNIFAIHAHPAMDFCSRSILNLCCEDSDENASSILIFRPK
jgi:hypothetical protein